MTGWQPRSALCWSKSCCLRIYTPMEPENDGNSKRESPGIQGWKLSGELCFFPSGVDAWMSRLEERINGSISPSYKWRLLELEPTDPNLLLSSWDIPVPTPPHPKTRKKPGFTWKINRIWVDELNLEILHHGRGDSASLKQSPLVPIGGLL